MLRPWNSVSTMPISCPSAWTMHVNLGFSLHKTAQALKDLYNIQIFHQQVPNYARTAAIVIKPFVAHYNYNTGNTFTADETHIKVLGIKGYI